MNIIVSSGTGSGPTEISAFDKALVDAGVANFNLIYLSSVIPPGSTVIEERPKKAFGQWGDKLYVVMAQKRTSKPNQEVWAGIGWVQDESDGRGLLVEHHGYTESLVRSDIENSLHALVKNRHSSNKFGPMHMSVVGTVCSGLPVCALVIATFESTRWKSNRQNNLLGWMTKANKKLPAPK